MFGSLLKEAARLTEDVVTVASAPVAIAVEVARKVTAPAAQVARETVEAVRNELTR
jgi:hypothetical protein